jgi:ribosomal protein L11 methyltransferase
MPNEHVALRFRASQEWEEILKGFLLMNADVEGIEEHADTSIVVYIPVTSWNSEVKEAIHNFVAENTEIEFEGEDRIQDRDWNAEWEKTIEPQWATPELLIAPSWKLEEARVLAPKHLITIDPKMSFGTGHHETTRLCLKALETIDVANKTVLDIGTGSGVLAMYALQRGGKSAVGIDTDVWSIDNAAENRGLNNITEAQLEIRSGTLAEAVKPEDRFDIILANIHRNVLVEIASDIKEHLNAGGSVILSGLLIYDADEVRNAYEAAGLILERQLAENEWTCLVCRLPR